MTLAIAFAFQGSRGLYETTEGRYSEVAREMLESGHYIEPMLGYRPHWTKPPCTYWAIAGGIRVFGKNAWGARFFNAIAFTLTTLLVTRIGILLWNRRVGLAAGIIYATSIFTAVAMFTVSTDTLLTLWEIAAVYCYLKASRATGAGDIRKWMLAMWVLFGMGFFTKGPPALLPLTAISVWHYIEKKPWKLFTLSGVGTFLIVGLWWYILVCLRHPQLLGYFLGKELADRIATDTFHRNAGWYIPFTMYFPALTLGSGVWFVYLIKTIRQNELFRPAALWAYLRAGKTGAFLLLWLSIPLLIFCIAQSRLILYVLPLYAPVALLIGRGIGNQLSLRKIILLAAVSSVALIGFKGLAARAPQKNNMKDLFSTCRQLGGKEARILSYLEIRLYGLQFYLDGNLVRLADEEMPWSDRRILPFIRNVLKKNSSHRYLIITRPQYGHYLEEKLMATKVPFRKVHDAFWKIYRFDPIHQASPANPS